MCLKANEALSKGHLFQVEKEGIGLISKWFRVYYILERANICSEYVLFL